ncbi:uncharacterized protein AB675_5681 [Cyphellophora attinorum]|uniref:Transmembrane protein n=1 Tax=Cyphellophora attinorum TaxID=1664694 RepID=A0A0N1P240_9EURO|nr:uncharacterized protein AB675_5681 [Phialophora attinorum]KPI41786.1 hypothetical protein AB675_5681 [Phialophora attinorum]
MSDISSFAALRKHQSEDLAKLAEEHFKHDLQETDKKTLVSAAGKVQTHALVGSIVGVGLGAFLAIRLRSNRQKIFQAFKAAEKPTHVVFASGRQEAIPDIAPLMKPTPLGDIAAYTFFSIAGLFVGGEIGFLTGAWSAKRTISADPEVRRRVETAFRKFRADVMRKQIADLEKNTDGETGSASPLFE